MKPSASSMTGYARSAGQVEGRTITVEARSVNHRFLDLRFRLPREFEPFEQKAQALARRFFERGRVEVRVELEPSQEPRPVSWNRSLASSLLDALREMQKELELPGAPELSLLASFKDVIVVEPPGPAGEETWSQVEAVLSECFARLQQMRREEGEDLAKDLLARVESLEQTLDRVKEAARGLPLAFKERLEKRLKELAGDAAVEIDPQRIAQEAALLAERVDITEELVRASAHLERIRDTLLRPGAKGRKLDFILQEIHREVNTMTNKAQDLEVSSLAVEMKAELEKMREQVQNLE